MKSATAAAWHPRRPPLSPEDPVTFRNGYVDDYNWMARFAENESKEVRKACHAIIFEADTDFDLYSRKEFAASCRKLAREDSEVGEQKGLIMALAHFRHRGGLYSEPLVEVAQRVKKYNQFYFLLVK